jgi:hypothetical protein
MGVRIYRGGTLDERFEGSVVVIGPRPTTMTGLIRGDLFVRDNSVCDVTGMISGNLLAERTGKAVLRGLVTKSCKAVGGDLEVYGLVLGDVMNEGGRIYVDKARSSEARSSARPSKAPSERPPRLRLPRAARQPSPHRRRPRPHRPREGLLGNGGNLDGRSLLGQSLGLLLAGEIQLEVRNKVRHDPVLRLAQVLLERGPAHPETFRDCFRRDLARGRIIPISVRLED